MLLSEFSIKDYTHSIRLEERERFLTVLAEKDNAIARQKAESDAAMVEKDNALARQKAEIELLLLEIQKLKDKYEK